MYNTVIIPFVNPNKSQDKEQDDGKLKEVNLFNFESTVFDKPLKQDVELKNEFVKTDELYEAENLNPRIRSLKTHLKTKREPKVYETSYDRCNFYDYLDMSDLSKVLALSKGELDNIAKSKGIQNHFSYSN